MKKIILTAATALLLASGAANASCVTNWIGGACGTPSADASHHANVHDSGNKAPEPDCPKKDGETS